MKPKLVSLDKSLNFQIYKLSLLLARELTKALKEFNLTPERWQILAALWSAGEALNQAELGEVALKDKPSTSRLVDSMVQSGWLIKKQSEQDSRAYLIRPSSKAISSRDKIVSIVYGHFEPYRQKLGNQKQGELYDLVREYIDVIEKRSK